MRKLTLDYFRVYANSKGGKLLSKTYIDTKGRLEFRCKNGHQWSVRAGSISASKSWCRRCAAIELGQRRKFNIKFLQNMAIKIGGKLLSSSIDGNSSSKLKWKCKNGHTFMKSTKKIREGSFCKKCTKIEFQDVIKEEASKFAKENKITLLSPSVKTRRSKTLWACNKGHKFSASLSSLKIRTSICLRCEGGAPASIKEVKQIVKKHRGKCLSKTVSNVRQPLIFICKNGHQFSSCLMHLRGNRWCRNCSAVIRGASQRKYTINDLKKYAKRLEGDCLSKAYLSGHTRYTWKCKNGHIWKSSWSNVNNLRSWCGSCSESMGERLTRTIFKLLFKQDFIKTRPAWLKNTSDNRMELDGYCKKYKVAFEYQGIQHTVFNKHFHRKRSEFEKRKKDDLQKREICKKKGIRLISIPFDLEPQQIESYVRNICDKSELDIPRSTPIDLQKIHIKGDNPIPHLASVADARGGKLISKKYITNQMKLKWQCPLGHRFLMIPREYVSGYGCPQCKKIKSTNKTKDGTPKNHKKLTIQDLQVYAQLHNGSCLSTNYNGLAQKHLWQCDKGHNWEAAPRNIIYSNRSWCPVCAGNITKTIEDAIKEGRKRGLICLSKKMKNTSEKIKWRCPKGHIWLTSYGSIVHNGNKCAHCAGNVRKTIQDAQKGAIKRGFKCLSKTMENTSSKLKWQCSKGHKWVSAYSNVILGGTGCTICYKNRAKD